MSGCHELGGTMVENGSSKLVREYDTVAGNDMLQNTCDSSEELSIIKLL